MDGADRRRREGMHFFPVAYPRSRTNDYPTQGDLILLGFRGHPEATFDTATLLTPSRRPMALKLMLPMPYSNSARAFIADGLPRRGVSVK